MDILFLLDGSESVSAADFMQQKAFVASQTMMYDLSPDGVRIGVIIYSSSVTDVVDLYPFTDEDELIDIVSKLNQPRDGTDIYLAIRELRIIMEEQARPAVFKKAVLITDGYSKNIAATLREAAATRQDGVDLIAIGVGAGVSRPELVGLAGDRRKAFSIDRFDYLFQLSSSLQELICPGKHFICTET